MLRLFVYGTLKRGFWNHDRFCRGVLVVEDAVVRGRLFETPSGIPVLLVPEGDILADGTTDPCADVATCLGADTHRQAQARFAARMPDPDSKLRLAPEKRHVRTLGPRVGGTSGLRPACAQASAGRRPRDPPPGDLS